MRAKSLIAALACCLAVTACATAQTVEPAATAESANPLAGPAWQGLAISYSGYREGQDPAEGIHPSREEVLEDLKILDKHWSLIRMYATNKHSRDAIELIRQEGLGLKVMLGSSAK